MDTVILKLPGFEGPIELLWALVQKNEVNVCDLELSSLIAQMACIIDNTASHLDLGAESMCHASNLLWMKSRALLPKGDVELLPEEDPSNLQVALLQRLVEYCRFKDAASHLTLKEEKAKESFFRPIGNAEGVKRTLGIEHVSLAELAAIFQGVLEKAEEHGGTIEEEEWRVSDKMEMILSQLASHDQIPLEGIFLPEYSKLEIIVFFLAILELMKLNEIRVMRITATQSMVITPYGKRN
jgi:segregation and condensation protein A